VPSATARVPAAARPSSLSVVRRHRRQTVWDRTRDRFSHVGAPSGPHRVPRPDPRGPRAAPSSCVTTTCRDAGRRRRHTSDRLRSQQHMPATT